MSQPGRLLLIEDDPHDVELTLTALEDNELNTSVQVLGDGAEALDYLYRRGQYGQRSPGNPLVILLDLKLPKVDGLEVLRQIRNDEDLRLIPVVMLTSSREERDIDHSYRLGVNAYVVKPIEFQEFVSSIREVGVFWAIINVPPPGSALPTV